MFAPIAGLLVLQERDRRLTELNEQIAHLPQEEARAKGRLSQDEANVAAAKHDLMELGVKAKNVELDVETRRNTITRLKQQQFETRKNEEFQALGHEVERYAAEVDDLETQQLEWMEKADAQRKILDQAEAVLAKSQKVVDEDLAALKERGKNLEKEKLEVQAERERLASEVEEELLSLYDRLLVKKKGVAIAPVHAGQCGGCHVKLIPSTLVKVQAEREIAQCENCGRILYSEA
ncbi:zinc ribbon domain-containing protein [Haloferula rosea]|uniref:C4-type zinc ribbon domain-containing protein n=1 Tax=Haloferula rosea TaxID=490093 RepID=A0A934VG43_9BACT|nr:C4-type zinc ribbon domain-containing protein [Haloferula rosea]MBK1827657.1 hypothetical protein [Haloferula rosea]